MLYCAGLEDSSLQIHILERWGLGLVYWEGGISDQVKMSNTMMRLTMMLVILVMKLTIMAIMRLLVHLEAKIPDLIPW